MSFLGFEDASCRGFDVGDFGFASFRRCGLWGTRVAVGENGRVLLGDKLVEASHYEGLDFGLDLVSIAGSIDKAWA